MIRKFHITSKHYVHDSRIYHKFCLSENKFGMISTVVGFKKLRNTKHTRLLKHSRYGLLNVITILIFIVRTRIKHNNVVFQFHDADIYYLGILAKLLGAKTIVDLHEDYFIQRKFNVFKKFLIRLYYLCLALFIDGFIFATDRVGINASLSGIVIRNLPEKVETNKFDDHSNNLKIRAIYVGSLSVHRQSDFMAELCRITPELQLDYYGDKPMRRNFDKKANFLFFCDAWRGYLHENKEAVFSKYDLGLCLYDPATHFEVLPVKSYEYQATGLYVLGGGNLELSRQLENGDFGMYLGSEPNVASAKNVIKRLHSDIAILRERRQNRLAKFGVELTWSSEFIRFRKWQEIILNG